jgi:hypothetical protein
MVAGTSPWAVLGAADGRAASVRDRLEADQACERLFVSHSITCPSPRQGPLPAGETAPVSVAATPTRCPRERCSLATDVVTGHPPHEVPGR